MSSAQAKPAWVIRAGRYGEREQWCLDLGLAGGGWADVPDLGACQTRESIRAVIDQTYPAESPGMRANATGQMARMRLEIQVGDLVVMPLKHVAQLAMGIVTAGYEYLADEGDPSKRHVLRVDWRVMDLPRTAVKQDLLHSLGSAMTTFGVSRHEGAARLWWLLEHGVDPGSTGLPSPGVPKDPQGTGASAGDEEAEADATLDLERFALDRITKWLTENFAGHHLQDLVAAVLQAHGYVVETPSKGADGGVDLHAGRGPLGLESPRIVGQVKSEPTPVGAPVVQQLQGAISAHGADQGLLVALGGLTAPARAALAHQKFTIRVWDSDDLLQAVFEVYTQLPEDIRSDLPLKQMWTLVQQQ